MEKINDLIAEAEDLSNLLVYRLKDSEECELAQHTVDVFRELVKILLRDTDGNF